MLVDESFVDDVRVFPPLGQITKYPPRTAIQPIAFFSRTLSDAEKRYWSTELETAGFLWTLRKTAKYINATDKPPVIMFTDHSSIIDMMRQKLVY